MSGLFLVGRPPGDPSRTYREVGIVCSSCVVFYISPTSISYLHLEGSSEFSMLIIMDVSVNGNFPTVTLVFSQWIEPSLSSIVFSSISSVSSSSSSMFTTNDFRITPFDPSCNPHLVFLRSRSHSAVPDTTVRKPVLIDAGGDTSSAYASFLLDVGFPVILVLYSYEPPEDSFNFSDNRVKRIPSDRFVVRIVYLSENVFLFRKNLLYLLHKISFYYYLGFYWFNIRNRVSQRTRFFCGLSESSKKIQENPSGNAIGT